MKSYHMYISAK